MTQTSSRQAFTAESPPWGTLFAIALKNQLTSVLIATHAKAFDQIHTFAEYVHYKQRPLDQFHSLDAKRYTFKPDNLLPVPDLQNSGFECFILFQSMSEYATIMYLVHTKEQDALRDGVAAFEELTHIIHLVLG